MTLVDAGDGKYSISCPWESEHTGQAQADRPRRSSGNRHIPRRRVIRHSSASTPTATGRKSRMFCCGPRPRKRESSTGTVRNSVFGPRDNSTSGDSRESSIAIQRTRLRQPYQARHYHGRPAGMVRLARQRLRSGQHPQRQDLRWRGGREASDPHAGDRDRVQGTRRD